jgi:hypothetical protein
MTSLALDRPSLSRLAATVFDQVLMAPGRVAHAHELKREVERILAMSDADLAAQETTREALLRAVARRA